MIKHLFKLIWNKKKQNFLLTVEMFVSFIVMFAVFTLLVYYYNNYKQPMNFDYNNVWVANYNMSENITSTDSAVQFHDALQQMMKSMPQVEEVSFISNNVPFSMSTSNTEVSSEKSAHIRTNFYHTEDSYQRVLNFKMLEGRWFNASDNAPGKYVPVVINEKLKQELFGNENAVGKIFGENDFIKNTVNYNYRIVGVMENIKDKGSYQAIESSLYERIDTGWMRWSSNVIIKVKPTADAAFESKLFKSLSNATGSSIEIEHLDKKLVVKNRVMLVPMIIAMIVAGFLIINVALGLFGVLWYNINKRRSEIGLRRAIGAPGNSISTQLIGEALVLATFALIIGTFFAIQFPLLNVFDLPSNVYIVAILLAIAFIYLLVIICSLYPGRQAAGIYPAVALHEE